MKLKPAASMVNYTPQRSWYPGNRNINISTDSYYKIMHAPCNQYIRYQ